MILSALKMFTDGHKHMKKGNKMNFLDLGLSEKTVKAINESGIITPTTVQTDVIPAILEGKDIFTIAPSGCGKTISYVLPLIDIISRNDGTNILIMTSDAKKSVTISDSLAMLNRFTKKPAMITTNMKPKLLSVHLICCLNWLRKKISIFQKSIYWLLMILTS